MRIAASFGVIALVCAIVEPVAALSLRRIGDAEIANCPGGESWLATRHRPRTSVRRIEAPPSNPVLRKELLDLARSFDSANSLASASEAARAAQEAASAAQAAAAAAANTTPNATMAMEAAASAAQTAADATADIAPTIVSREQKLQRLRKIVSRYGVPTKAVIGGDGMGAFWELLQGARQDPEFQLYVAERIVDMSGASGIQPSAIAGLIDTVLIKLGRLQRYGTQLEREPGGRIIHKPIENPAGVEARRAALRLMPAELELCIRRHVDSEMLWVPVDG